MKHITNLREVRGRGAGRGAGRRAAAHYAAVDSPLLPYPQTICISMMFTLSTQAKPIPATQIITLMGSLNAEQIIIFIALQFYLMSGPIL